MDYIEEAGKRKIAYEEAYNKLLEENNIEYEKY